MVFVKEITDFFLIRDSDLETITGTAEIILNSNLIFVPFISLQT